MPSPYPYLSPVAPATAPNDKELQSQHYALPSSSDTKKKAGHIPEARLRDLTTKGFTRGLAASINQSKEAFALRIWVVDNSGSMSQKDGHRIIDARPGNHQIVKMAPCTRWEEIRDCVSFHIRLAGLVEAPTTFRLLNKPSGGYPQQFGVAEAPEMAPHDVDEALSTMQTVRPNGCTPLTQHILDIHTAVTAMEPQLRTTGQRVVIVIATDGLPSDSRGHSNKRRQDEFVEALRTLEGLPVWVVIRLCTDDDDVVQFYNELDSVLELSIEVLDDFIGEAKEVYQENPWLNYALPLHRLREMGYHDRVFDMLDERLLTKSELRDFCALLFGEQHFDGIPDPSIDWKGFVSNIERLLQNEHLQWNPMKKKATPWIDLKKLNKSYSKQSCTMM